MFKLDFFRPFSRHGTARASAALPIRLSENVEFLSSISRLGNSSRLDCTRLNEMVRFQQSFSLHGKARASAALPIWLSENVGLSFEQVGREAIRPGCPTLGSEIHAVVHSSGFVFFESFRFGCLRPFFRLGIARILFASALGSGKTYVFDRRSPVYGPIRGGPVRPDEDGVRTKIRLSRAPCKFICMAEAKYLRRSQRYEKSSAEASVSLIMPRRSI